MSLRLNKALALAIGWKSKEIGNEVIGSSVFIHSNTHRVFWARFDYRDWNVIGPIAERYNCFPLLDLEGGWSADCWVTEAPTPQEAIARAMVRRMK